MTETILAYSSGQITAHRQKSLRTLVDDISFELKEGESMALIGETGSGKTMIALSIMGLLPENVTRQNWRISFCGKDLPLSGKPRPELGIEIVYIPQNGMEFLNPSRKVKDHLFDSLERLGVPKSRRKDTAAEKLRLAGLKDAESFMEKYPFQLSGGEAQRVTIAISACSRAKLLIADEPTNGLDPETKNRFLQHINALFPEAARLIITHDFELAGLCSRVLVMCGGKFIESGSSEAVLQHPHHPYTQALQEALVRSGMKETPVLRGGRSGCPFFRRCPKGNSACGSEIPLSSDGITSWRCVL